MKLGREYQIDKIETGPARNLGVGEPPSNYLGPANHHTMTEEIGPACNQGVGEPQSFSLQQMDLEKLIKISKITQMCKTS